MNRPFKYKLILVLILLCEINFAQQLSIEETIDYINENLDETTSIEIKNDGTFIKTTLMSKEVRANRNERLRRFKANPERLKITTSQLFEADVHSLSVDKIIRFEKFVTELKCKSDYCITWTNYAMYKNLGEDIIQNTNSINFFYQKQKPRDKVFNAFQYLLTLIEENDAYPDVDEDPFANKNFKNTYGYVTGVKNSEEIKLIRESGVYHISIDISGVRKRFVLDSGASEISLSSSLEKELIARGILKKESYLEPGLYRIADGSVVAKRRVLLREIKVGNYTIKNVTASIGSSNIPLLLGKSFLDKFSRWTIDNETEKLILEK